MTDVTETIFKVNNKHREDTSDHDRYPCWLNNDHGPVFSWIHLPKNKKISKMGVVICNPLGYEYSHTHRTIRHLCDNLAYSGFANIRFDYHGTGDSFSDLFEKNRIKTFLENIDTAIEELKIKTGVTEICLIGLRMGATLAASYCNSRPVDKLILWSACIKGRTYVREMQALEKLASHSSGDNPDLIDSGGFIVTDSTAKELKELNLLKQEYHVNDNILVIERDDLQKNDKLLSAIEKNNISNIEHHPMKGYIEMMEEPQFTVVPELTISKIINWLSSDSKNKTLNKTSYNQNTCKLITNKPDSNIIEQICYDYENKLIGILSYHSHLNKDKSKPLIILTNSGSVHRVGPNRVYVQLARSLASEGYPVLRFDLSNLGDSVLGKPENENNPYSDYAMHDIAIILEMMVKEYGFNSFIISGICSGAHNAFHAGLIMPASYNIKETIIINPLRFYSDGFTNQRSIPTYQVERDSQQYSESLLSLEKWKKLLSGKVDLIYLSSFIYQKALKTLTSNIQALTEKVGIHNGSRLTKDLNKYISKNMKISFFIASKDPGKKLLMNESRIIVNTMIKSNQLDIYEIPNADHTFSSLNCRKEFVRLYVEHIKSRY